MKKVLTLFYLCVLFFILDNTLVPFFAIRGYFPNLLLTFCILYSIINGSLEGLWLGVFSGILQDLYFFHGFGINAFANMLVCAAAGYIGIGIFKEKALIPIMSSLGLSLIKGIIVFSLLFINNINTPFINILYNSLYNMILAIIMYKWVYKLCQKRYMQRKWSFKDGR
jgi:rod shape-determining protein MreD